VHQPKGLQSRRIDKRGPQNGGDRWMPPSASSQGSMQPEIILHIGTHKTGTTSIQRYLGRHRDELKELGIWYPRYSELIAGQADHYAHLDFARSIDQTIKNPRFSPQEVKQIANAIVSQHQDYPFTVISAEPFWRVGFTNRYSSQTWKKKDRMLKQIKELFLAANVRAVAILRNQPDFIESLYSEVLLSTGYAHGISHFIEDYDHYFQYKRQLDAWAQYFPVKAIGFSELTAMPDLARGFLTMVTGINETVLPATSGQRWNATHPVACVAMKRYLNGIHGLSSQVRTHLYHRYKRFFLRRFNSSIEQNNDLKRAFQDKRKRWLSKDQIQRINDRFQEENQLLARDYYCRLNQGIQQRSASDSKLKDWEEHYIVGWMLKNYPPSHEWFESPCAADSEIQVTPTRHQ
jgi:hypothetical protein